jgi:hypothetical protein
MVERKRERVRTRTRTRTTAQPVDDTARRERRERTRQAMTSKGGGGFDLVALPEGVEMVELSKGVMPMDFVPYVVTTDNHPEGIKKGDIWWRRKYAIHRNIGVEMKAYVCRKTINEKCPICDHMAPLYKKYKDNEAEITAKKAKDRDLYPVLCDDGIVRILDISWHNFTKQLGDETSESGVEDYVDFFELHGGYTVHVRWTEEVWGDNTFHKAGRIDFEKRADLDDNILQKVPALDEVFTVLSYEELEVIFLEIPPDQVTGGTEKVDDPAPVKTDDPNERCPSGGVFGKDADQLTVCQKCPNDLWNQCMDAAGK